MVPWLRILDAALGLADIARSRRQSVAASELTAAGGSAPAPFEARFAGVVVAALKEAFNRDASRLEFEREQVERERERADRALKLELLRQTGERELGRLRVMAATAAGSWVATLAAALFSARLTAGGIAPRVLLGFGWALLLGALASAFVAQSHVTRELARLDRTLDAGWTLSGVQSDDLTPIMASVVPWLIVIGFAAIAMAVLVA